MIILAIESSCDEFSVAIQKDGVIISNIISSQIDEHTKHGGVVPELASRLHVQNFNWVLNDALDKSDIKMEQVDEIAYTQKPGLIGSLIIGQLVAKTLGDYYNIPVKGFDHIQGHIYAANIESKFVYPVLSLVVSGGHTQIIYIKEPLNFEVIGTTQDDAVGECYDKVARVLGLGYPGGPKIDKLSLLGESGRYDFPKIKTEGMYDFSFSGLKTASINLIHKVRQNNQTIHLENFCRSFQENAMETILTKFELAINDKKPATICVGGGVSANEYLRKRIFSIGKVYNVNVSIPNMEYCTDNAAMIAELAYQYIQIDKK